ncbi:MULTISPECIES: 6-phosphofructokinase [Streptomyces]|uniref:Pyrophosphate--fructose 6-phosphate 1-phosphotransferase n=2 Tax=Streptomyces TaxID=1883 RepID=A0A2U9NZF6_STRAS|nr:MULTISPECIES: 6-phosphofructokinase [Streptomyces]AWT42726.1 6-phosphofructokinase [Streptomyces actuosus]MBM4819949.1 6-phosphofructokinase [Streptomyces actuosus]GHF91595.1 pyrophosphate--fructose 6-phosphate 1-phosphotransferase [Streptomyces griseosporeus]
MRVGVLTGGRDCPGLNAVVRAVVRKGVQHYGDEFVGFVDGWRGPLDGETVPLDIPAVRGTLPRGGTILGTSRTHPLDHPEGVRRIRENLAKHEVEALITIGGRDTLGTAARLADEYGLPIVGVPKTIDNDLSGTDCTIGYDTAVGVATGAIDRLHTTAESHKRVLVVEVMGGDTGWIALRSGLAGGANVILIPEQPFDVEQVCAWVTSRFRASYAPIVVVADGAYPKDGSMRLGPGSGVRLSGVGEWLAREIEHRSGKEARTTVLGHLQRGGSPSPFDRWLATRFGLHAIDAVHEQDFGTMVALRGTDVVRVPIAEATARVKRVDPKLYEEVGVFFG